MPSRQSGFTLIELMIVVVVISILSAMAIPSYSRYVVRGKRSAAQAAMMDLANRQQQFLIANRAYADKPVLVASGYALPPEVSENYDWDIALGGGPMPRFTITLTGTGAQSADGALSLDSQGVKTPMEKWH